MRRRQDPIGPFEGGVDSWDQGPAGRIITEEFFGTRSASPGTVLVYLGIDRGYQPMPAKVWTGTAWVVRGIRFWSGAAWVLA